MGFEIRISTVSSPLAKPWLHHLIEVFCTQEDMPWEASIKGRELPFSSDPLLAPLVVVQKVAVTGKDSVLIHVSAPNICSQSSLTMLDLTGIGIAQTVKGIQDAGVIACAKHFIGNEQVRLNDPSSLIYHNPVNCELSRE